MCFIEPSICAGAVFLHLFKTQCHPTVQMTNEDSADRTYPVSSICLPTHSSSTPCYDGVTTFVVAGSERKANEQNPAADAEAHYSNKRSVQSVSSF